MQTFEEILLQNWANRFECPVSTLQQTGTTLLPNEKYVNQIVFWHIGKHAFALFDPAYNDLLQDSIARLPANTSLSGENIQQTFGSKAIASHDLDLLHYLYPPDLPQLEPPPSFHVRQLTEADQAYLAELHANCTPEEVDNGYVEIDHEIVFGCFLNDKLVSATSGYRMAGFMDIGILTHANFRQRGLGKAVVGALCSWSIAHNIVAQYRCNIQNTGSLGMARSLNFRPYFRSENIMMEDR